MAVLPLLGASASTTVGVDARTGRLVRRVVVAERVVSPRAVSPKTPVRTMLTSVSKSDIENAVEEISANHGVDPLLVQAVIHAESAFNRFAISPKGAQGLMQLMPGTARQYGVTNSFDYRQNIEGGVRHLRVLQSKFDDLRLVLAAYNAGEEAVFRYNGVPPYAETIGYVYKVGKKLGELRRGTRQRIARAVDPPVAAPVPPAPEYRPFSAHLDAEGKLHLRSR